MNAVLIASLAVGAAAATGTLLLARELVPAPPALGPALQRLYPQWQAGRRPAGMPAGRLPVPDQSLALLGRTRHQYLTALAVGGLAGLALPVLLTVMAAAGGRAQASAALAAGGVATGAVTAALGALVVHLEVLSRARRARRQFRPVVATYLSLVAMERAAGHGSVESLERAAQVGDGPAVRHIRRALQRARAHHRPPWEELEEVATHLGVPELADVGQIMHSSGLAGAQVHRTLLQRAQALRDQVRTELLAEAERTTTKLEIPGVLLLFLLVAFFLYPLTQQIDF